MKGRLLSTLAILILIIAGGAVLVGVLLFLHARSRNSMPVISDNYSQILMADTLAIPVSIADTIAERQQGLSNSLFLPTNAGKLFVFQEPGTYGFWMKDMNYPLDFVWIDSAMKIIAITPNVSVDSYPKIFYPPQKVLYVLEVNAGFSTIHNLMVGEQLSLLNTLQR